VVERPAQEGFHLLIKALTDAAHLRFGDAAGSAQRLDQGFVDPAARFEPVGEEAALPEFGDGQGEVAHGGALIRTAFMELGAGRGRNLSLQQDLEAAAHDLRDQGTTIGRGSWSVFGLVVVLRTGSQNGPPIATALR